MAIACFAGAPRVPKASQNGAFEDFGGQVGQEHVIAAHLDGEGTAFSAPSVRPRGCQKKTNFEDFLVFFFGSHSERTFGGFQT